MVTAVNLWRTRRLANAPPGVESCSLVRTRSARQRHKADEVQVAPIKKDKAIARIEESSKEIADMAK